MVFKHSCLSCRWVIFNRFGNKKNYPSFRQQFQGQGRERQCHRSRRYPTCIPLYTTAQPPKFQLPEGLLWQLEPTQSKGTESWKLQKIPPTPSSPLQMAKGSGQNKSSIPIISQSSLVGLSSPSTTVTLAREHTVSCLTSLLLYWSWDHLKSLSLSRLLEEPKLR